MSETIGTTERKFVPYQVCAACGHTWHGVVCQEWRWPLLSTGRLRPCLCPAQFEVQDG